MVSFTTAALVDLTYSAPINLPLSRRPPMMRFLAVVRGTKIVSSISVPRGVSFWNQSANDGEGHALDPDELSDRIVAAEKLLRHRLADERHLGRRPHFRLVEPAAVLNFPVPGFLVFRRHTPDDGRPVLITENDLSGAANAGSGNLDRGDFVLDGDGVVFGPR